MRRNRLQRTADERLVRSFDDMDRFKGIKIGGLKHWLVLPTRDLSIEASTRCLSIDCAFSSKKGRFAAHRIAKNGHKSEKKRPLFASRILFNDRRCKRDGQELSSSQLAKETLRATRCSCLDS